MKEKWKLNSNKELMFRQSYRNKKRRLSLNRNFLFLITCLLFSTFMFSACGSGDNHEHVKSLYTCPMHPDILRDNPGSCPICGMDLVLKIDSKETGRDEKIDPTADQNPGMLASITTVKPVIKEISLSFNTTGYITYDTRRIYNIAARYNGRIEKLYVKYSFQPVEKGQKLMDVYSQELLTEQNNLIYLLNNDSDALNLVNGAKQKLKLLGLTSSQIEKIASTGKALHTITIYSPYSGHLHESEKMEMEEQMEVGRNFTNNALTLKEGMYIRQGESIFNIADVHNVWAIIKIPSNYTSLITLNSAVKLKVEGVEDSITGKVDFIDPLYDNESKSMNLRIYLPNHDHHLKIGSLVNASIKGEQAKGLWIPKSGVLDLGKNKIVWLKKEGTFKPQVVQTGKVTESFTEIINGLKTDEEIALNANYFADSEGFINTDNHDIQ